MTTTDEDPVDAVTWMIRGHWVSLTIRAAIELGLLDELEHPTTVADLATATRSDLSACSGWSACSPTSGSSRCQARRRALGPGHHHQPRAHPDGRRTRADCATSPSCRPSSRRLASWQRLADAVRTGASVFEDVNGIGPWESLSANPEQEAIFNASMARRGVNQVAAILRRRTFHRSSLVVDVGGGRGAMLAGLLAASPGMRGIVADRADVAAEAQTYLEDAGLGDRAQGEAADFFTPSPVAATSTWSPTSFTTGRTTTPYGSSGRSAPPWARRLGSGSSSTSSTPRTGASSSARPPPRRPAHAGDVRRSGAYVCRVRRPPARQRLRPRRPRHDAARVGRHRGSAGP